MPPKSKKKKESYQLNTQLDNIVGKLRNSSQYYQTIRDNWVKYYKKYRGWLDSDSMKDAYRWRSKLFIPSTAASVDGLVQNLYLTFFGTSPFFDVKPREPQDVDTAKAMQALLSYQFEHSNFKVEFRKFLLQLVIYGTAFGKVYWRDEKRTVKRRQETIDQFGFPSIDLVEKEESVYDGPIFEALDNFDVFVSQTAKSLEDSWVIQRSEKTVGQLKLLQAKGIYSNIDELENLISSSNYNDPEIMKMKQVAGLPSAWSKEDGDDRKIEILEYWNRERTKVITIAGRLKIIREVDNPLYIDPFIYATLWDDPGNVFGIGIPEKVNDLQDQLNSEVNQRLDNRNLRQNLIIKVQRGMNVNVSQLISRPGAVWLMDDLDAVQTEQVPDISSNNSFTEEGLLKQEIEEVSGVTKYVKGSGGGGDRTATEASLLAKAGSKGFACFASLIEEMAMKPIIRKYYQLNELFLSQEKIYRLLGSEASVFATISPSDIKGDFDFIPTATSELQDKNLKSQQLIQLLQIAANDPSLNKQMILKKLWENFGYQDFNQIYTPLPPMPIGQMPGQPLPPQNPNGPVEPTGMRPASPMEGMAPMMMGGGGNAQ